MRVSTNYRQIFARVQERGLNENPSFLGMLRSYPFLFRNALELSRADVIDWAKKGAAAGAILGAVYVSSHENDELIKTIMNMAGFILMGSFMGGYLQVSGTMMCLIHVQDPRNKDLVDRIIVSRENPPGLQIA